jgi:hypothetical protein
MNDDEVRKLLGTLQSDQPPLGIQAPELLRRGQRMRRVRTGLAVASGSLTAAAAAVVIAVSLGNHAPAPAPVVPATRPPAEVPTPVSPRASCALRGSPPPTPLNCQTVAPHR